MNDLGNGGNAPGQTPSPAGLQPAAAVNHENPLPRTIRVFVVDDHPVVRKGLQMLLNLQLDMQVCGDAVGVATARQGIATLLPDLVIVDLGLDDGDGFELMGWIRRQHPHMKMLVFTSHDDAAFAERSFQCGALGYVVKQDGTRELIRAIRLVMQDQQFLSSKITSQGRPSSRPGTKD